MTDGEGVTQDEAKAAQLLQKAADKGHAAAMHNIAVVLSKAHS